MAFPATMWQPQAGVVVAPTSVFPGFQPPLAPVDMATAVAGGQYVAAAQAPAPAMVAAALPPMYMPDSLQQQQQQQQQQLQLQQLQQQAAVQQAAQQQAQQQQAQQQQQQLMGAMVPMQPFQQQQQFLMQHPQAAALLQQQQLQQLQLQQQLQQQQQAAAQQALQKQQQRQTAQQQEQPQQQVTVETPELLAAVESLYQDELKPYGRILRKRLAERAQAVGRGSVDIDIRVLKAACEACELLTVQAEEGSDWSALIRGRAQAFVDVYSPTDIYPADLWAAAGAYFGGLDDSNMVLPGGRYSCAQVLMARNLPFLASRTLGQVCHIVQLAISQKKLLGYLNGAVVPYSRSQSMVKERCAERQRPCTSAARGTSTLVGWDTVRTCLQEIISSMGPGVETIPLSNLKRLFRSRFHMELSETSLGYAKLSELLQDQRLQDVCTVRLQGHGYVVVPKRQPPQQPQLPPVAAAQAPSEAARPAKKKPTISLADSLPEAAAMPPPVAQPVSKPELEAAAAKGRVRPCPSPLSLEDIMTEGACQAAAGTAAVEPLPVLLGAKNLPRARSDGKADGSLLKAPQGAWDGKALPTTSPAGPIAAPASGKGRQTPFAEGFVPSTPAAGLMVPPTPSPTSASYGGMLLPPMPEAWPGKPLTPSALNRLGYAVAEPR